MKLSPPAFLRLKICGMGAVIYQIYPRSFRDSNADGVGDLRGILEKVDYIASLGCDYVWISPFFRSPQKDYGYDVSDFRAVDPVFGTNEDFYELIRAFDARGLKVMVDFVIAHTSDQHAWFEESRQSRDNPKADWYVWADPKPDGTPPNNWMSVFGGPAWRWEPRRQQYYMSQFLPEQPCLNHYCPAVHAALVDTMEFWLEKGVRGFRIDALQHAHYDRRLRNNPPNLDAGRSPDIYSYQRIKYSAGRKDGLPIIRDIRRLADRYPGTLLLGEVLNRGMARLYTGRGLLHTCYFGDLLAMKTLDAAALSKTVGEVLAQFPKGDFCWSVNNHDFMRHVTRMKPAPGFRDDFAVMTAALFMLLPGGYCLYQGEELGLPAAELSFDQLVDPFDRMQYPHHQGRDTSRTPMPWAAGEKNAGFSAADKTWLPVDAVQAQAAVDAQEGDEASVLNRVRKILAWRKENPPAASSFTMLNLPEGLFGFRMTCGKAAYRFVFNLTPVAVAAGDLGTAEAFSRVDAGVLPPYGFSVGR